MAKFVTTSETETPTRVELEEVGDGTVWLKLVKGRDWQVVGVLTDEGEFVLKPLHAECAGRLGLQTFEAEGKVYMKMGRGT